MRCAFKYNQNMKIIANGYFDKIEDITREHLTTQGIVGIILDIDNTVVEEGVTDVRPSAAEWISDIGLPICLLSNGKERRVSFFARTFGTKYVFRAGKPFTKGYKRAAQLLEIEDFSQIAVIGDQLLTDILGGNKTGCYTIKVAPIDVTLDPLTVKVKRWLERFFV